MPLRSVPRYDGDSLSTTGTRAVVAGAGMAGLLATRILADGFEKVTLVEHDRLPDEPNVRSGVPQSSHVHALLEAGRVTLGDLFPGYCAEVQSGGGVMIDAATEFRYFHDGDFLTDGPERLPMLCASRPLFEHVVRNRLSDFDRVSIRSPCTFQDYLLDDTSTAVTGVRIANENGTDETVDADLVVDATGRSSRTSRWLTRHGYSSPPVDEVQIDLAYSTVSVERPPEDRRGFLVAPSPSTPRGGTVVPVEGDRWMVTLFGLHGDHPPADVERLREFARSLPTPEIYRLLDAQSVISDEIQHYPFPSNRWMHYEALDRFPSGLVATGDAFASFNPIYGQGMSVAALDALQLHHALVTDGRRDLGPRFFDRIASIVNTVWRMTVSADFVFPETDGPKPRGTDLFNWYFSRLVRTAHSNGHVTDAVARVLRLERTPTSLVRPGILARVFNPF